MDALQFHQSVIVNADDTDVLVLYLSEPPTKGLFLKRGDKVYNIGSFQAAIDPPVLRHNLIVFHSFYGCDTTSGFFAHPSYRALTMSWAHLAAELAVFKNSNSTHNEIHKSGSKLEAAMYKCDPDLSSERLRLFKIKCNSKTHISLERLPPTPDASDLHSLRAFLTTHDMLVWQKDPLQYGWRLEDGVLEPIPMKQEPAPSFLLEMKQCGCASGCESKRERCGCVKDGVPCISRCTCSNCKNPKNCEDSEDDDVGGQVENDCDESEADEDTWDDIFYQELRPH